MSVHGNTNGLKELADKIRQLTSSGFKAELGRKLGAVAQRQVLEGFRDSRDPYGHAWEPLRHRKGKPLIDTGQLRQSVSVSATGNGFQLRIGAKYAGVHQYGAKIRAHARKAGSVFRNKRGRFKSQAQAIRASESAHNRWAKAMEAYEDGARKSRPRYPTASITQSDRAAYQHGGMTVPRRQMFPERDTGGLGPIWTKAFNEAADDLIRKRLLGKAA